MVLSADCALQRGFCRCAVLSSALNRFWFKWSKSQFIPNKTMAVSLWGLKIWQSFFRLFFFSDLTLTQECWKAHSVEKQNIRSGTTFCSILPTMRKIIWFARKPLQSSLSTSIFGALLLEYIHNKNLGSQRSFSTTVRSPWGLTYFESLLKSKAFQRKVKPSLYPLKQL